MMQQGAVKKDQDQLITVFVCFLKSGLRFNREDTNAVGQTLSQELKKQNPDFKPAKVQQREKKAFFTVNGYPRAFEPLIMACIQEYQKERQLPKRLPKKGFRSGGGQRPRRDFNGPPRTPRAEGGYRPGSDYPERRGPRPEGGYGGNPSPRPYPPSNRPYGAQPRQEGYYNRRQDQGAPRENGNRYDNRYPNRGPEGADRDNQSRLSPYPQRPQRPSYPQDQRYTPGTPPPPENPPSQDTPNTENPFRFTRKKPDNFEEGGQDK
jgi:hypothetical protein